MASFVFCRISEYSSAAEPPSRIVERLRGVCESGHHVFWADDVSLRDVSRFVAGASLSHRQVTDVYLLSLAKRYGGRLATFDRTILLEAVPGGVADDLIIISE